MGVFPAASCKHVPEPFAELMSDPVSVNYIVCTGCLFKFYSIANSVNCDLAPFN